jgi:WD40 repeat protein
MSAVPEPDKPAPTFVSFAGPEPAPANTLASLAALDATSPDSVPRLCELLKETNPMHRKWAAEMLVQLGPDAVPGIPTLIELLRHPEAITRQKAAEVLSALGPLAEPAAAALREALADRDDLVKRWVARALGEIGPSAKAALPELLQFRFKAVDTRTAAVAAVAARKIDPSSGSPTVVTGDAASSEICRFFGHTSSVQCVALSPDGRLALSGSGPAARGNPADADCSLRLWDLAEKRELRSLFGHADRVTSVAFFSDGRRCLSSSYDGTLRVWDIEAGTQLQCLTGHTDRVRSAALSPDGRLALSGGCDQTVRLWDLQTGREVRCLHKHGHWVVSVGFSADGVLALSGSLDGSVRSWNVRSGRQVGGRGGDSWLKKVLSWPGRRPSTSTGPKPTATSVAFAPDGRRALIGTTDKKLRLCDLASGEDVMFFPGHTAPVMCIVFTPDGSRTLSGSMDQTLRLWDVASGRELQRFDGHTDVVMGAALSRDAESLLSGGADRTVRLWRLSL